MNAHEWIPPSKARKMSMDFAGLGIPPGSYVLPDPVDYLCATDGSDQGYENLINHFRGEITLGELPERDIAYLRKFFGQQIAERRDQAVQHFTSRVPRRYAAARPDAVATAWAKAVGDAPDATRSLLIVGPTGTGKTHYGYSVLRAVAENGSAAWRALTAADMYAQLRPRAGRDSEAEFESISKTHVLFVDDLAAAKLTEWTEEVTYRLINHRYEQCLPGLFTSNVPPAQLRDALGERIASRLVEMCERIVLKGDDRRKGMAA
jgi:DNA replication protein DnaC